MSSFDNAYDALYERLSSRLSESRLKHTLGVCKMADLLAGYCLPEERDEICFAAMLHDVAKELTIEQQLCIMKRENISIATDDSAAVYHSYVAPYVVRCDFPNYATPKILSAIEKHTVGDAEMSVFDEIIFLADYIEEGRTYPDCVRTRDFVLSSLVDNDLVGNINVLHKGCVMAIDLTCKNLLARGKSINTRSFAAKNALEAKIF